eukprot:5816308-Pleurochrysis_carterae.AAC.1
MREPSERSRFCEKRVGKAAASVSIDVHNDDACYNPSCAEPLSASKQNSVVRNEADVELLQLAIKQATTRMRSEAAWVVSSERAGSLFALDQAGGADAGFEQLR